ncbi:MAG: GNAT family N-acetyltransferase [Candidatus Woesearchaeota archaeon]
MEIKNLSVKEIKAYSNLARKVISSSSYYTEDARSEEIKKFSEESLQEKIKDESNFFVFIEDNGEVVAFFSGYFDAGTFWASWLGVDFNYRNKGFGKRILIYVERELKRRGIHKVWFDTLVNNVEIINLVEMLGFKKVTRINNHWYKQDFYLWEKFI